MQHCCCWGLLELPPGGFWAGQKIAGDILGREVGLGDPPVVPMQFLTLECGLEAALTHCPHQLHLLGSVDSLKEKV